MPEEPDMTDSTNEGPSTSNPIGIARPESHYSHVAVMGNTVFVAGQVGVDASGTAGSSIEAQTRQAYDNVKVALESVGSSMRHIVRLVTYVVDRQDIGGMRDVRTELFERIYPDGDYPPHTLLVVAGLAAPEYLVEIEATAVMPAAN